MQFLGKAAKFVLGGGLVGQLLGKVLGGAGKPKQITAQPLAQATRDDAAALAARDDELRRRKGSAADLLTGTTGAEAVATGKFNPIGN